MFLDDVTLDVAAGSGGRGAVSFRREKYVPRGGPDGGDGGRGGSVLLAVELGDATLGRFRQRRRFRAPDGGAGGSAQRSGATGPDLVLQVPAGTVVTDADSGELIGDLTAPDQRLVVAAGGAGGRGNTHFTSSTRQAPRIGELGGLGEHRRIRLELKLIADIGLVGLPNAGKSTLLTTLTGARPKIAAYPFTTLTPNLGVAELSDGQTLVLADVPGLIEGAHRGAGLGIEFLRHLERTRVLIHLVDGSDGAAAARRAIAQVGGELRAFSPALAARPTLIALNKVDLTDAAEAALELSAELPDAHPVSAASGAGLPALLSAAASLVAEARAAGEEAEAHSGAESPGGHRVYRFTPSRVEPLRVGREPDGSFRVSGGGVEKLVSRVDLEEDEAVAALQLRLASLGVDRALAVAGCREGDTVRIAGSEFFYAETGVLAGAAPQEPAPGGRPRGRRQAPRAGGTP